MCFFKKFRCFNAENLGSVGQWAAKLPAIKLSEWLDRDRESNPSRLADWGRGRPADFFLRPPTLTASNFAALWPTDPKFSAFKHLNLLKKHTKNQEASSILRVVFTLSKWPHLHREWPKKRVFLQGTVLAVFQLTDTEQSLNCWWNLHFQRVEAWVFVVFSKSDKLRTKNSLTLSSLTLVKEHWTPGMES